MNNEYQFTASELIHLFVDGEATAAQQSRLFSLLAADVGLQEQFRAAVLIQKTLEQVRATTVPPVHYTTELFAKAGFATSTAIAAEAPVSWIAGLSTATKGIALSLCSALAGACIAVFMMLPYLREPATTAANDVATRSAVGSSPIRATPGEPVQQLTAQGNAAAGSTASGSSVVQGSAASGPNVPAYNAVEQTDRNRHSSTELLQGGATERVRIRVDRTPRDQSASLVQDESGQEQDAAERLSTEAVQEQFATPLAQGELITAVQPVSVPQEPARIHRAVPRSLLATSSVLPQEHPEVTVYLKNVQALDWYPQRDIPASTMEENLMFGALYHVSRDHAFGAEVGRELMPLYSFANNMQIRLNTMLWAGGLYQYQPESLVLANTIQPFFRLGLGGTGAGPMGKALLGMHLQTSDFMSAAFGLEGSLLAYRRGSVVQTTGKLGFMLSLEAQF